MNVPPIPMVVENVDTFQIIHELVTLDISDQGEYTRVCETVKDLWVQNNGCIGFINLMRREIGAQDDGEEEKEALDGDVRKMQVLKIFAHEDVFVGDKRSFLREIISVARIQYDQRRYGVWVECQEKLTAGEYHTIDVDKDPEMVAIGSISVATPDLVPGLLYFKVQMEEMKEEKVFVPEVDSSDEPEVNRCFERIGKKIADTLQAKRRLVVALTGMCGCGKSTKLPKIIHKHSPKATIFVVEARRHVAVSNAYFLRVEKEQIWKKKNLGWPVDESEYQKLVDLLVGLSGRPDISNQRVLKKTEVMAQIITGGNKVGHTVFMTTGCFENVAVSILRARRVQKGHPIVIILSDWEEKTLEMAKTLIAFKNLANYLEVPFVIVMASQANLVDPWLSWVCDGVPVYREYTPALLKEFYKNPVRTLNPKRYKIITPSSHTQIRDWEVNIMRLIKSQSGTLLKGGGCVVVKVLSNLHCFRLARAFADYQEELVHRGHIRQEDKIRSVPYCSSLPKLPDLTNHPTILFATDIIMYGVNLPRCRAIVSCGMRRSLQFQKAFGLTVLSTKMMTLEEWFQLCGRIDRNKLERGLAFTLLPLSSPYRTRKNDILVASDESFLVSQVYDYVQKAKDMVEVSSLSPENLAQFGVASETRYSLDLLNCNYCLTVGGPYELNHLRQLLKVLTITLGQGRPRWKMVMLQLWLLHQNKVKGCVPKEFEESLLSTLKYIAFVEDCDNWVYSSEEVTWLDYANSNNQMPSLKDALDGFWRVWKRYPDTFGGYGGEGYQSLLFMKDMFYIKVVPSIQFSSGSSHRRVLVGPVVDRFLMAIANMMGHFVTTRLGAKVILRDHFRLLCDNRWEEASEQERVQLVLCNTRPLQVAKFTEEQKSSKVHYAMTIVNKQVVYFDDPKLKWSTRSKLITPCGCTDYEKKTTRFIYFGKVRQKKVPKTKFGALFEVKETMAVAHEIGCTLEKWFSITQAHLKNVSVITEITREKDNTSSVDLEVLKKAHNSLYEEDYNPTG